MLTADDVLLIQWIRPPRAMGREENVEDRILYLEVYTSLIGVRLSRNKSNKRITQSTDEFRQIKHLLIIGPKSKLGIS